MTRRFIPPPLAGEGGERSEPGGGSLNVTPPGCSLTLAATLPFQGRDKKAAPGANSMQRATPPFRADHVGSLLRPAALKEARIARANGTIDSRRN